MQVMTIASAEQDKQWILQNPSRRLQSHTFAGRLAIEGAPSDGIAAVSDLSDQLLVPGGSRDRKLRAEGRNRDVNPPFHIEIIGDERRLPLRGFLDMKCQPSLGD